MARQIESGFLLPRERERLDKKRKEITPSEPHDYPSSSEELLPPGFPSSTPQALPPDYFPPSIPPPLFETPLPPSPSPLQAKNPASQPYFPFPMLNPLLFAPQPPLPHPKPSPHHPLPLPRASLQHPVKNAVSATPPVYFPPHFSPLPQHLQVHNNNFSQQQYTFPNQQNGTNGLPHPFPPYPAPPSLPPSSTPPPSTFASPPYSSPPYTSPLPASPPPSSSLPYPTTPPPSSSSSLPFSLSSSPSPARRVPEYAAVLADALRRGITDAEPIYNLLRTCYEQMKKGEAERRRVGGGEEEGGGEGGGEMKGREGGGDVDECDEKLMQEMMHMMSEVPLSLTAMQRPPPLLRGVVTGAGELMNSDCDVIIHCCNCYHRMGAGIAKTISEKYPSVVEADKMSPKGNKGKLGHFTSALTYDGKTFINLYAQYHYGWNDGQRKLNYKALKLGLTRLAERLRNQNAYPKIGSYYMGCFHAGGDKEKVKQIFNEVFYDMPIYIYTNINYTDPARQITNKFYDYNKNAPKTESVQTTQENTNYYNTTNNNNNNIQYYNNNLQNNNTPNFVVNMYNEY